MKEFLYISGLAGYCFLIASSLDWRNIFQVVDNLTLQKLKTDDKISDVRWKK